MVEKSVISFDEPKRKKKKYFLYECPLVGLGEEKNAAKFKIKGKNSVSLF